MATPTIALVDDDRNILTSVSIALEAEGFDVKTYSDPAAALAALSQQPPDIAVLDIKMPRMDGMEVLRRLRLKTDLPVIFLTLRLKTDLPVIFLTSKDEEIDEVLGLRMGADDYIRKPFSQRLLIERIRAVLRRRDAQAEGGERAEKDKIMTRGKLTMDPMRRDSLMDAAYDDQVYVDDRTIDSHIKRIRKKFRMTDDE